MTADIIRIVDAPVTTPTVLFDFNDENPCGVAKFSAPPPQLVRTTFQTQARDGANEASSVYGDRLVELDLDLYAATQAASATTMQKMFRLLSDPAGQWLQYQPAGAPAPVFFRLRRGDVSSIADIAATAALRELHLTLPAEPFAYGLAVTGSAIIANDPLAATNPMSYVFPDVQGDVATPLLVKIAQDELIPGWSSLVATTAMIDHAADFVLLNPSSGMTLWESGNNWSSTVVTGGGTGAIGSSYVRITRPTSPAPVPANSITTSLNVSGVTRGDYRVLVRAQADVSVLADTATVQAWVTPQLDFDPAMQPARSLTLQGDWQWVDVGVVRLPAASPISPKLAETDLPSLLTSTLWFRLTLSAGVDWVAFDSALLIPAGLDDALSSRLMMGKATGAGANSSLWVDGINESAFAVSDTGSRITPFPFGGGLPRLVPGAKNRLFFVGRMTDLDQPASYDPLGVMFSAQFLYFPRYMHVRPATS